MMTSTAEAFSLAFFAMSMWIPFYGFLG